MVESVCVILDLVVSVVELMAVAWFLVGVMVLGFRVSVEVVEW